MSHDPTTSSPPVSNLGPTHFSLGGNPPDSIGKIAKRSTENADDLESQLVDQTKLQIRSLVQEIAELSKSDCTPADFYEGFLTRTTSALASIGGAIWLRDNTDEPLKLQYHINLKQTNLATDKNAQSRHSHLLKKLMASGEPTLISPNSGSDNPNEAGNPTDHLLVIGPLKINQVTIGLVEIFQRANAGPTTQRGYLRFVTQMSDLASEFLTNQRLRSFAQAEAMWQQLEGFIRAIHQGLDTEQTVYTIANEGRRITGADRLSLALGTGRRCRVAAVSGLDSIERRAEQIKRLNGLAATVIRTGQAFWYDGDDANLPPQIERQLHEYVDKSHCKMLAIIPLKEQQLAPETDLANRRVATNAKPIGALIIEQLKDSRISPALRQRVDIVASHSETALTNSLDHNSVFLMPVWKHLGRATSLVQGAKLFRTIAIVGVLIAAALFLALFPYQFGLGASGSLVPETQHEVFAQVDGVLQEVFVSDTGATFVDANQPLARMTNNDLLVEIENLQGQIEEANQKRISNKLMQTKRVEQPIDRQLIAGEMRSLEQTITSLTNELDLKLSELKMLEIMSPSAGQVVNWQVRQSLLRRPVLRGQNLMTIIDPNTRWQIELEMPERRLAHLIIAMNEQDEPLQVTFGLLSHPGVTYHGQLLSIDRQLDVHSDEGNSALVRVGFANADISPELLRAGTRVTAKIDCGQRSIGYVMFHELIETVQAKVLFWL